MNDDFNPYYIDRRNQYSVSEDARNIVGANLDKPMAWLKERTGLSSTTLYRIKREFGWRGPGVTEWQRRFVRLNIDCPTAWLVQQTGLSRSTIQKLKKER